MEITSEIKNQIEKIAKAYGLKLVVLFGSQATGKTHSESDVDIAYFADNKISFEDEIKINTALTEIFGNNNVQLVNIKKAPPLLLKKITEECVIIYEKEKHIFDEIFIYSLRIYEEAKPLFELREHYLQYKLEKYA